MTGAVLREVERQTSSLTAAGGGALRARLDAVRRDLKLSMKELTVLSKDKDPYRLDTPAGHRDGGWLTEQMERLGYIDRDAIALGDFYRKIHLRGLHYALVVSEVPKPNGEPYRNTEDDWDWLQEDAAKAARWLGYVPFEAIADARNAAPVINRRQGEASPRMFIHVGVEVHIPSVDDLQPQVSVTGFEGRQAHHLVLFGEKTSLEPHLAPVAKRYGADLYLPAGEISDTLVYQMARDGAADGRPMVVFTFSDCDPAGWQMPVSIGRKLQALRDLAFPHLEFEVRPACLIPEQVRAHDLPDTPLKETEKRASNWRKAFGIEQTEIDALAALRPELLRNIADEAIAPFFDRTLERRVAAAERDWRERAQAALEARLDGEMLDRLREEAADKLTELETEIDAINAALQTATDDLDLTLPTPWVPEPDLPPRSGLPPLLSSKWTWHAQTHAMIRRKRYADSAGDEP